MNTYVILRTKLAKLMDLLYIYVEYFQIVKLHNIPVLFFLAMLLKYGVQRRNIVEIITIIILALFSSSYCLQLYLNQANKLIQERHVLFMFKQHYRSTPNHGGARHCTEPYKQSI